MGEKANALEALFSEPEQQAAAVFGKTAKSLNSAFIDAKKARFPASRSCGALGVSQSGFFAWKSSTASRHQRDDMVFLANIDAAFALSSGTFDSPGMHRDMLDDGHATRRRRLARTMPENKLIAFQKRRFKRTADSQYT